MPEPETLAFTCNGTAVEVAVPPGESLLGVLREHLGVMSAKDGCAPQGQCGCCTVLVDGDARVACVTPASRVAGRAVTTVEGLDPARRNELVECFLDAGASQCGFCTPGIVMRAAAALAKGRTSPAAIDRALAAHLCRCTGWRTILTAVTAAAVDAEPARHRPRRDLDAASRRAALEGGNAQQVSSEAVLGDAGFADDTAPRDALVGVPLPPGGATLSMTVNAAGIDWVVAASLYEARHAAGKTQGRRTTLEDRPPLTLPPLPDGRGVRLATSWVEPAFLEPDASWCAPGGTPASPLANGGAFGAKRGSLAPRAARELAGRLGRTVRVVLAREDTVRLGPKRPPMAAAAVFEAPARVRIAGVVARGGASAFATVPTAWPYALAVDASWEAVDVPGPPTSPDLRAAGLAEHTVLIEGALAAAGTDRSTLVRDERVAVVLLDACAGAPSGACAGARAVVDAETGAVREIEVRVAAGDPLDEVVLRSYATGAAHMALGWVCAESVAVDPATGEVQDLTIRSFGVVRAKDTPPITVEVVDEPGPPLAGSSDAVFAAVAAATWNALAVAEGERPETFPARSTRAARLLRR